MQNHVSFLITLMTVSMKMGTIRITETSKIVRFVPVINALIQFDSFDNLDFDLTWSISILLGT